MSINLRRYADKRHEWIEQLSGGDRNSVSNQLTDLSWDMASYEIVATAVELAPKSADGFVKLNALPIELIQRGFLASFMVYIRRLNDRNADANSFRRILLDMKRHGNLFTRENMLAAEEFEYDYEKLERSPARFISKLRHEQIDQLAGVSVQDRSPSDCINKDVFENLRGKLDASTKKVADYVNNFLAHSAGPHARGRSLVGSASISYEELRNCHKCFCEVTGFLLGQVFYVGNPPMLAFPQYDQFECIDRPLVSVEDVPKLKEKWRALQDESHTWSQWGIHEYQAEFGVYAPGYSAS